MSHNFKSASRSSLTTFTHYIHSLQSITTYQHIHSFFFPIFLFQSNSYFNLSGFQTPSKVSLSQLKLQHQNLPLPPLLASSDTQSICWPHLPPSAPSSRDSSSSPPSSQQPTQQTSGQPPPIPPSSTAARTANEEHRREQRPRSGPWGPQKNQCTPPGAPNTKT